MHVQEESGADAWSAPENRYDSQRVAAEFSLLRRLAWEKCPGASSATEWVSGIIRAARILTLMGATIGEAAYLKAIDNLPSEMKDVSDAILAGDSTTLEEVKQQERHNERRSARQQIWQRR